MTLIFALHRYEEVTEAYLAGMEQAREHALDLSRLDSVASFFVSRVDTETDARLEAIGGPDADGLKGLAAIANARLAYRHFERMLATNRWRALAAAGAHPQRPLWASTSVKNPAYPDTRYVTELVAPLVVNTMPEATLRAVADHGVTPRTPSAGLTATHRRCLTPSLLSASTTTVLSPGWRTTASPSSIRHGPGWPPTSGPR